MIDVQTFDHEGYPVDADCPSARFVHREDYERLQAENADVTRQRDELVRLCHHYTDFGLSDIVGLCGVKGFPEGTLNPEKAPESTKDADYIDELEINASDPDAPAPWGNPLDPAPCCCYLHASEMQRMTRMIVCSECGNKRCPKATDHALACTGSNDTGQPGSRFL